MGGTVSWQATAPGRAGMVLGQGWVREEVTRTCRVCCLSPGSGCRSGADGLGGLLLARKDVQDL